MKDRIKSLTGDPYLLDAEEHRPTIPAPFQPLIEYAGDEPEDEPFEDNPWWPRLIVGLFIVAIALIAMSQYISDILILSR